jgi:hypothetical protein
MGGHAARMGRRGTRIGGKARYRETARKVKTDGWIILRSILER